MAGILNNKTRILDTILTKYGRHQLVNGEFQVKFITFTDGASFYHASGSPGVSDDASSRIYFEAAQQPQDMITFTADDSGKLLPFPAGDMGVLNGNILSGSRDKFLQLVTGSQFASLSTGLLTSSLGNFKKLYSIGSRDSFSEADIFTLSENQISFELTDNAPIDKRDIREISVTDVESFIQDKRLQHLPNFQHLPPINKPRPTEPTKKEPIGFFPRLGQSEILSFDELMEGLSYMPNKTITFENTSQANNIIGQFFEQTNNSLKKLDVIDFGTFLTDEINFPEKRVFFVGKIFIDGRNMATFVNLFTLIFE